MCIRDRLAIHPNPAAVCFDDRSRDIEAETETARVRIGGLFEPVENAIQVVRRDTGAGIGYVDTDGVDLSPTSCSLCAARASPPTASESCNTSATRSGSQSLRDMNRELQRLDRLRRRPASCSDRVGTRIRRII